jgi:hypothetical protein
MYWGSGWIGKARLIPRTAITKWEVPDNTYFTQKKHVRSLTVNFEQAFDKIHRMPLRFKLHEKALH